MLITACIPLNDQCPSDIETSPLICSANHLTGFYMRETLVDKGLRFFLYVEASYYKTSMDGYF